MPEGTSRALLTSLFLVTGCADEAVDRATELSYSSRVLARHHRRIELLRAGVRPRPETGVKKVWRNAMGYTFVARRPDGEEEGISGVRILRRGVPVKERASGLRRGRFGRLAVQEGYWIVDVFSSVDTHLRSAVVPEKMPERRLLQHLGLAREVSDTADRVFMVPAEQVHWRELLPVIRRNDGYGPLYARVAEPEPPEEIGRIDTVNVMGKRYLLETVDDYVLVGDDRAEQRCWHVFTPGEEYLVSVLHQGLPPLDGPAALGALGLAGSDSTRHRERKADRSSSDRPTTSTPAPTRAGETSE